MLGTALLLFAAAATPCENLASLRLDHARRTSAVTAPEGPPPARGSGAGGARGAGGPPASGGAPAANIAPPANIPAHCRVQLTLNPTSDSMINMELWLPVQNWNGEFMGVGNGGFAGSIQGRTNEMPNALRRGYATAGTDTGTQAPGGDWAIGHPEKMIDFAYRSTHEMTLKAKEIVKAFYDQPAKYSYFKGCSTGGRMALMEAQRYPADYNGIIAGSLANRHIHMWTAGVARSIELSRHPERNLTAENAALVNQTVADACDTLKEGFLNNPRQCTVNFSKLLCAAGEDDDTVLTSVTLRTCNTFYGGVKNAKGELIFSGQALGNPIPALRGTNQAPVGRFDIVRIAFNDPNLDWQKFDL